MTPAPGVPFYDPAVEKASREALRELQIGRLRSLLGIVWAGNPFYRKKWQAAGLDDPRAVQTLEALASLPFTTKGEIAEDQAAHPPFGSNLSESAERYTRIHQTSGTTGRPIRWLDTEESWRWWTRCWEFVFRAAGVGPEDRVFFPFSFGPFIGFWAGFDAAWRLGALAIPGGGQDSVTRLRWLGETGATVVVCTPSYALRLADVAGQEGIDLVRGPVRVTIHAGEPGASIPATKRRIQAAWGARCFDHAGLTEVGAYGFECTGQPGGIHVNESEFIVEVIDPAAGRPVAEGEEGELVLTNLGRGGSPVFRYRTGDRVRVDLAPCTCGRTFARLAGGILGRTDDMLIVRGMNVFPSALEGIVRAFEAVDEFRIEVGKRGTMDELRLLLEIDGGRYPARTIEETVRGVMEAARRTLGLRIEAATVPAGTLPRFELKARRVVRQTDEGSGS